MHRVVVFAATLVPKGTIDAFSLEFNRVDTRVKLTDDSVVVRHSM